MSLTDEQATEILYVHNALWNAVYDHDSSIHTLSYKDTSYQINIPPNRGYASVLLPNSKGTKFLWITQNLHKSTYGTLAIQRQTNQGNDHRITWVVDTNNGQFNYRSNITTTKDPSGLLLFGAIEIYDSLGKEIIWSNNQMVVTRKAAF